MGKEHYMDDDANIAETVSVCVLHLQWRLRPAGCVAALFLNSSCTSPSVGETASLHPAQATGGHGSG